MPSTEVGDYQTAQTLETFGFLPKLSQDEVYDQIAYLIAQGWTPAIEHEHPSKSTDQYWTMWKLPLFGEQNLDRVVEELVDGHRQCDAGDVVAVGCKERLDHDRIVCA